MYQAARSVALDVSAAQAWEMVSDFHGLYHFHPLISTTRQENHGLWRRDMFKDLGAGSLEERLHFSDRTMCYSYRSINAGGGFWPIDSYFGKFKVWPRGDDKCGVLWSAQLVPSDPENTARNEAMVGDMIENEECGLQGLIERFGGAPLEPEPHNHAAAAVAHLAADADTVWSLVGDFFRIDEWIPNISRVERVSNGRRFVHLAHNDQVDVEDEIFRDDDKRTCSYNAKLEPAAAYPCCDYIANIKVWPRTDGGCGIVWSGQNTPNDPENRALSASIATMMREEYQASLEGLTRRFGGKLLLAV